jgi:outer membrane murein-binding lipoprotein Lpp
VFDQGKPKKDELEVNLDQLYAKIGQLEMERDFLKKSLAKLDRLI